MTSNQLQERVIRQIFIGYLSLICLTLILYTLNGIIDEELASLLTTLSSLSALYVAPAFQFFSQGINNFEESISPSLPKKDNFSIKLIKLLIPLHFIIVALFILCKAFNIISFKELTLFLGFIETTFGTYMGFMIIEVFKMKKNEK